MNVSGRGWDVKPIPDICLRGCYPIPVLPTLTAQTVKVVHALRIHERVRQVDKELLITELLIHHLPLLAVPRMKRQGTDFVGGRIVRNVILHLLLLLSSDVRSHVMNVSGRG